VCSVAVADGMHVRGGFVKFRVGLEGEPTSGATTRAPHTKDHAGLAVLAVVEDAEVVMPRLVVVDHGGVGAASEIGHGNANVAPDGRGKEDLVPKVEHQRVSDLAAAVTLAPGEYKVEALRTRRSQEPRASSTISRKLPV